MVRIWDIPNMSMKKHLRNATIQKLQDALAAESTARETQERPGGTV